MTGAPRGVLDLLNGADLGGPWSWSDAVMVLNVGAILSPAPERGDLMSNRGFNLVLFDRSGAPEYYCKVRPSHHTEALRGIRVLVALRDAGLDGLVPRTWEVASTELLVQVSEHVPGVPFSQRIARLGPAAMARAAEEVLALADRVSRTAAAVAPAELVGGGRVAIASRAAPVLEYLADGLLSPDQVAALGQAMEEAGEVPGLPQHGDLWAGNVVQRRDGWTLLDFELFGLVDVPLYDVLHFLRTTWYLRNGHKRRTAAATWLASLAGDSADTALARTALRSQCDAMGLTGAQVRGMVAYYVTDIAYRSHRRRVPGWMSERLVGEAAALGRMLRSGVDPVVSLLQA